MIGVPVNQYFRPCSTLSWIRDKVVLVMPKLPSRYSNSIPNYKSYFCSLEDKTVLSESLACFNWHIVRATHLETTLIHSSDCYEKVNKLQVGLVSAIH